MTSALTEMRISKSEIGFIRSLGQRKVRDSEKKFLIEGWKSLEDALRSEHRILFVAAAGESMNDPDHLEIFRDLKSRRMVVRELTGTEMKNVSDTVHSQGVVAVVEQGRVTLEGVLAMPSRLLVIADRVADPGNMGTMIRTCDWFGVDALLLSVGCVDAYNEKVVRSTSGSIFHIPIIENIETARTTHLLKEKGFRVFATAGDAPSSFTQMHYGEKNVLIFGNEASGISDEIRLLADDVLSIPKRGKAESLNVGVACGIILSHVSNSR